MKLSHLISEARPTSLLPGKLGVVDAVLKELEIKYKFEATYRLNEEMVDTAIAMMRKVVQDDASQGHSAPVFPLEKVIFGLKRLPEQGLHDLFSGLDRLKGQDAFMTEARIAQISAAASLLVSNKQEMLDYCTALLSVMHAILMIKSAAVSAMSDEDAAYRKSIARAGLKQLGFHEAY
jgi:uncharacterized protein (DUF885 family)